MEDKTTATAPERLKNLAVNPKVRLAAAILLPLIIFAYLFGLTTHTSLNDPDIWWHLKTGEYIYKNKAIFDKDPFAYTSPYPLNDRQKRGLQAHWLGQVFLYTPYKFFGLPGVGYLRGVLIVMPLVIIYIWLIRQGLNLFSALTITTLPAAMNSIQLFYAFERPQGFSFTFAVLAVLVMERLRKREKKFDISWVLLPLLTALWSNVHAGFIIGNIIIVIYMVSEAIEATFRKFIRKEEGAFHIPFFAITIVSILTSFINPNTYHLFWEYFSGLFGIFVSDVGSTLAGKRGGGGDWVRSVVLEYRPLIYFYKHMGYDWLIHYWIMTAVLYVAMIAKYILRRSFDLKEFLTVSFITLFANMYARGLMFALPIVAAYTGKTILELKPPLGQSRFLANTVTAAVLAITMVFGATMGIKNAAVLKPAITDEWVTPWYPTKAAAFLHQETIAPPMYNYYTWGGYLIWSLYPKYKVFIDGRALDNAANKTADGILKGFPRWRDNLDAYGINFIVIPMVFRESGHIIPMAVGLAYEPQWKLVFIQNNSAVFVRDIPQNQDIIRRHEKDKKRIFLEILSVESLFLSADPANPVYNMAKADAFLALGNIQEAKKIYQMFPNRAADKLRQLRQMGY